MWNKSHWLWKTRTESRERMLDVARKTVLSNEILEIRQACIEILIAWDSPTDIALLQEVGTKSEFQSFEKLTELLKRFKPIPANP